MAELNKWQVREARQYAEDNGVSYEVAVAELFPPAAPAKKAAAKVDTSKATA